MLTSATTHPATSAGASCADGCAGQRLLAGPQLAAAGAAVAELQLPSREEHPAVDPDSVGQAGFNPFATVGTVVQEPAPVAQEPQGGDWSLPVLATLMGIILIAWLLRKLVQ